MSDGRRLVEPLYPYHWYHLFLPYSLAFIPPSPQFNSILETEEHHRREENSNVTHGDQCVFRLFFSRCLRKRKRGIDEKRERGEREKKQKEKANV